MKRCTGCKQEKDKAEFNVNQTQYDGLQTYCKECQRAYQGSWREKNSYVFDRIADTEMAKCSKCERDKPASEFNTHKNRKGGIQSCCKECQNAYQKVYRERRRRTIKKRERRVEQQKEDLGRLLAERTASIANAATLTTIVGGASAPGAKETPGAKDVPGGFKCCSKCKVARPVSEFARSRARSDGLQCWCKQCLAKSRQELLKRRSSERAAKERDSE